MRRTRAQRMIRVMMAASSRWLVFFCGGLIWSLSCWVSQAQPVTLEATNLSGPVTTPMATVRLALSAPVAGDAARQPGSYELLDLGADRIAGTTDDRVIPVSPSYIDDTTEIILNVTAPLAFDLQDWSDYDPSPVDLGGWTLQGGGSTARWSASFHNTEFFFSPFEVADRPIGLGMRSDNSDDDLIGCAFAAVVDEHSLSPDTFYVMTWKRGNQSSGGLLAEEGIKLLRVEGAAEFADSLYGVLWDGETTPSVSVLGTHLGTGTGWTVGVTYTATIHQHTDSGQIDLAVTRDSDAAIIWQTSVVDPSPLPAGRVGFYNQTQPLTYYSARDLSGFLPDRAYRLTVTSGTDGLTDTEGQPIDGNADGTAEDGDNFTQEFTVDTTPPRVATVGTTSVPRFDGKDDRIRVANTTRPTYDEEGTVELWFRTLSTGRHMLLATLGGGGTGVYLNRYATTGGLLFFFDGNSGDEIPAQDVGTGLNDGVWHHAAAVYDHGEISVYIDGVLAGTEYDNMTTGSTVDGWIGADGNGSQLFPGQLCEVRVWNVARTAGDISSNIFRRLTGSEAGLVGYWPLDEIDGTTAYDLSPYANHGIAGGGETVRMPTPVPAMPPIEGGGRRETVLDFNGSGDYLRAPDASALDLTTHFTIEAWIDPTAIAGADRAIISKVGGSGGNNGYQLGITAVAGGSCVVWIAFNAAGEPWTTNYAQAALEFDPLNRWTHVAATYDHSALRVYINGNLESEEIVGAKTVVNTASGLRISGDDNNHVWFQGRIAEARIWHVARSGEQIRGTMFSRLSGDETALAGYWPINDAAGTQAKDYSLNANHLSFGGAPAWGDGPTPLPEGRLMVLYREQMGMDPASVADTANYALTAGGGNATFDDSDEIDMSADIRDITVAADSRIAVMNLAMPLGLDYYQVAVDGTATVRDLSGNPLNDGSDYVSEPLAVAADLPSVCIALLPDDDTGPAADDGMTAVVRPTYQVTVNRSGMVDVDFDGDGTADESRMVGAGTHDFTPTVDMPEGRRQATVTFTPDLGQTVTTSRDVVVDTLGPEPEPLSQNRVPRFDGTNDFISTPALQGAFVDETCTLALWFRAEAGGVLIAETGAPTVNASSWHTSLMEILASGEVLVRVWNLPVISVGTIAFGTWHHVAVVYDRGAQITRGYLDGAEAPVTSTGDRSAPWESARACHYLLGATDSTNMGHGGWFRGMMAHVSVWSTARTGAGIRDEMTLGLTGTEPGLVLYYPLDEGTGMTATDATGSYDGLFGNGSADASPTWDTTPPNLNMTLGSSLAFDGNDYVTMGDVLDWGDTDSWTVEAWFRKTTPSTDYRKIVNKGQTVSGTPANAGYQLRIYGRTIHFSVTDNAGHSYSVTTGEPAINAWHHVAGVLDRTSGHLHLYLDGRLVATTPFSALGSLDTNIPLAIGALHRGELGSTAEYFIGNIGEVRMWNVARTPTDIMTSMRALLSGAESGLAACWRLDDVGATSVADSLGNAHDGTLGGLDPSTAPVWSTAAPSTERRTLAIAYCDAAGMDPVSVAAGATYTVVASGGDGTFDDGNETDITAHIATLTWDPERQLVTLGFAETLPDDFLKITINRSGMLIDLAGNAFNDGAPWSSPALPSEQAPPTVTIDLQAASDSGVSDTDDLTHDTNPTFDVSVNMPGILNIDFDDDGTTDDTIDAPTAGTYTSTATFPLPDGISRVTASFRSWLGSSTTATISVLIDTVGATASLVSPGELNPAYRNTVRFSEFVDPTSLVPDDITVLDPIGGSVALESLAALRNDLSYNDATGHWYLRVHRPNGITWPEADILARSLGGYLVTLNSSAENTFVYNLIAEDRFWYVDGANNAEGPWIGLRQVHKADEPAGGWMWVDGSYASYTAWRGGEPSNGGGAEDYAVYFVRSQNWNDISRDALQWGCVVEFDSEPVVLLEAEMLFSPITVSGEAPVSILPRATDLAGNPLNQDGDTVNGEIDEDAMAETFSIVGGLDNAFHVCRVEPTVTDRVLFDKLRIVFSQPIVESTLALDDIELLDVTAAALLTPVGLARINDYVYELDLTGVIASGIYELRIGPDVQSTTALVLDQDRDGTGGEPDNDVVKVLLAAQDMHIPQGDASYENWMVLVNGAVLTVDGVHTFTSVRLLAGATLTHSACTATTEYGLDLRCSDVLDVDAESSIDVSQRGYLKGTTVGNTTVGGATGISGSSHGGYGIDNTGNANEVYDAYDDPQHPGAGGGTSGSWSAGGGLIRVQASVLRLDGALKADGNHATGWGNSAGAGGGIRVDVNVLWGFGTISANGGNGASSRSPAGGGRIAVYCDDASGFDFGAVQALAGAGASVGTVYVRQTGGESTLRIDSHGGTVGRYTPIGIGSDTTVIDDRLVLAGSGVIAAPHHQFPLTFNHVDVLNGANLTHRSCTDTLEFALVLTVNDTLTVDATSAIETSERGYLKGRTVGNTDSGAATGRSGGTHGGYGVAYGGATNDVYDVFDDPLRPGAGGGSGGTWSAGGGVVRITAQTIILDGAIRANGNHATGWYCSAGAGGSIRLAVASLEGSGAVSANGGNESSDRAAAGGGRVAITYDDVSDFDLDRVRALGGAGGTSPGSGAVGTVFLKDNAGEGVLRIDSHGAAVGQWTPLGIDADTAFTADRLVVAGAAVIAAPHHQFPLTLNNVDVLDGANLTHRSCTDTLEFALRLTVNDTLTIDATSAIDASSRGYLKGRSVGNTDSGGATGRSGGTHGGYGVAYGGTTNDAYGAFDDPMWPGAGGGSGGSWSAGGGVVRIAANTITLDGAIRANGNHATGWNYSAGAGGSIRLAVASLEGSGAVSANGGNEASDRAAAGGGRVAITYDDVSEFDLDRVRALGGAGGTSPGSGAVGTVFLKDNAGQGVLRIDSHGASVGQWTPLATANDNAFAVDRLVVAGAGVIARPHHQLPLSASDVDLVEGGVLSQRGCTATDVFSLLLSVRNVLSIDTDSAIDVSALGYPAGYTDGHTTTGGATGSSGGSYGGLGISRAGVTNAAYGSETDPDQPGAGGGVDHWGPGGGLARIQAGTLQVFGAIRANGNPATGWGNNAGAGGGLRLDVGVLGGTGMITANGGNSNSDRAAGGGGRIAITSWDINGLPPENVITAGGTGGGGNGTIVYGVEATEVDRPFVTAFLPVGLQTHAVTALSVVFNETIDTDTFGPADVLIWRPDAGTVAATDISVTAAELGAFDILIPALEEDGTYGVTIGPDIADEFGTIMSAPQAFHFRINRFGPRITGTSLPPRLFAAFDHIDVVFDEAIAAGSFGPADISLGVPDGTTTTGTSVTRLDDLTYRIALPLQVQPGDYELVLGPRIGDADGNAMDQNRNGIGGEAEDIYIFRFELFLCDLAFVSADPPAYAIAGQSASITWTVTNQGDAVAGRTWNDAVYLSTDELLDAADVLLSTRDSSAVSPLAVGVTYSRNAALSITLSTPPGDWFLIVVLDDGEGQPENDEANNTRVLPLEIRPPAPDLTITNLPEREPGYVGFDLFNITGTGQTKTQGVVVGDTISYAITVRNLTAAPEAFTITGGLGGYGWIVDYMDAVAAGADITDGVTGAGWLTPALDPGETYEIRVDVTPGAGLSPGSVDEILIHASATDASRRDTVKAASTVALQQFDVYPLNDFETSADSAWSRSERESVPSGATTILGRFSAETVTLSIAGLPDHSHVQIDFDLILAQTWDGDSHADRVDVDLDGQVLLVSSFALMPGTTQSFPRRYPQAS